MKTYLLLRDNQESGPFTREELIAKSLKKFDLVWIEGQSGHWEYASEIEELKAHIVQPTPQPVYIPQPSERSNRVEFKYKPYVEMPKPVKQEEIRAAFQYEEPLLEKKFEQPLSELKERYSDLLEKEKFQFGKRHRNSGMWIMALFIMLIGGAAVIKSIIENNEVTKEKTPVAAAVPLIGLPEGKVKEEPADESYKNALSTEVSAPDTVVKKTVKKISMKEIRKKVTVSTNKYKVRMFGGVDDLQLNVHNGSSVKLDKVNILVSFLKPNGEEIKSASYSVYSVAPGSTKILVIPPSKRGVKVRSVVTGVESKQPSVSQI